ncbi:alpha/beta fold hydrolase [Microbispora sp. H13382]|uniref:alpha/beta fold hydrolase n=1 Tax=Microbispora sp. H13382 TaxID=2729112 RepID=UPI001C71BC7F|nr:alpha/beta hydrolase [Microbispora sp. H13382]
MSTVTSADGTPIAFDRVGGGPPVVLVGGALRHRACDPVAERLAAILAPSFTVIRYDRRGRGGSGDTAPYAVAREIEDIEALVAEAGGAAAVCGFSSGAVLALDAARRLPGITRLAVVEPPFVVDDSRPPLPQDYLPRLAALLAAGRRGDAVEFFLTRAADVPAERVALHRRSPAWPVFEAAAHTLVYDGAVMGATMSGAPLPAHRWACVTAPVLVTGRAGGPAFLRGAARALAGVLPCARLRLLAGAAGRRDHPETVPPGGRDHHGDARSAGGRDHHGEARSAGGRDHHDEADFVCGGGHHAETAAALAPVLSHFLAAS